VDVVIDRRGARSAGLQIFGSELKKLVELKRTTSDFWSGVHGAGNIDHEHQEQRKCMKLEPIIDS
jgi:hypothetical protein